MAIERYAHATWEGDLLSGSGRFDTGSGAITGQEVTFASRFTEEPGGKTSPEELLAAAHATCISMALAHGLAQAGHPPTRLETDAVCSMEQTAVGFRIRSMHITLRGQVDVDEETFRAAAEEAKKGCPVSNALGDIEIELDAALAG
jgi:osmotically inducible protein OsmC